MVVAMAKDFIQEASQAWVTVHEPAAEGDTIGLVVEFFWVKVVEGLQLRWFQYISVQGCNPIYWVAIVDIHVSHVDTAWFVDDVGRSVSHFCFDTTVQLFNNRH